MKKDIFSADNAVGAVSNDIDKNDKPIRLWLLL